MATARRYEEAPEGTVPVPRVAFHFRTAGVEIEGGCDAERDAFGVCCPAGLLPFLEDLCPGAGCTEPCAPAKDGDVHGVDVQFPWEALPSRFHARTIEVGPFFIDRHLVAKDRFAEYLNATGYTPRDSHNFLVGWSRAKSGELLPPAGEERQPVVWVSLEEARGFCAWQGKRLPHAYEWQLAAQGEDGRSYPWGDRLALNEWRFPEASRGPAVPPLPATGAFSPGGDSVYGMADVVGHVWQMTDEFRDEHARALLLKGSSLYTPMLSDAFPAVKQPGNWYFPKAQKLDRHNRLLLMDESYDRAGTVGFRCLADHAQGQEAPYHYKDVSAIVV